MTKQLKPFVKWAGGKGQLLHEIRSQYPTRFKKYVEPFVGGGAVLFDILSRYDLEEVYISDINAELINAYRIIRDNINELIVLLQRMQDDYLSLDQEGRKEYYYEQRRAYNAEMREVDSTQKAAWFIFLNRTCFNGLYRVNKRGEFNVPVGSYKNPIICDEHNLRNLSEALTKVQIVHGDYKKAKDFIDADTLVYFDPPYRPLTETARFTSYTVECFDDNDQIALATFIDELHQRGAKIIASNSDPKNISEEDNFFDVLYSDYIIRRVKANRMINSKSESRGKINELLIVNYGSEEE
ncbi:DNA adenine methylase [Aerococcaceae bacterium NML190073]|nr:DNA adenine methylase [Aerococcaceae bacterium NML190073]